MFYNFKMLFTFLSRQENFMEPVNRDFARNLPLGALNNSCSFFIIVTETLELIERKKKKKTRLKFTRSGNSFLASLNIRLKTSKGQIFLLSMFAV